MPISLIIHGYPRMEKSGGPIYDFFERKGWQMVVPDLFTDAVSFTKEGIRTNIKNTLAGRIPDVVVGVSLGGLIAPSIIKDYPEAKLIMIATGPYLKPDFKIYNLILRLVKKRKVLETLDKLLKLFPEKSLLFFYKIVNRHHSNGPNDKRLSQWCAGQDIKAFLKISAGKGREIIDYATNIDNQIILGTIRNKTLILGGENDILMPLALSEKLKDLLIDSSLVVTAGEHFNVFNKEGLLKIEKFLAE